MLTFYLKNCLCKDHPHLQVQTEKCWLRRGWMLPLCGSVLLAYGKPARISPADTVNNVRTVFTCKQYFPFINSEALSNQQSCCERRQAELAE